MAAIQAIVCCAGVLALGVQAVNVPGLFVASAASSLAYLSVIYMLSVVLQHIGKGLCIVLVFAQIPGASGLYPIEMTSKFFQAVYPFFPFTYGIDAIREAIGGFYGNHFAHDITVLACIFFVSLILGILLQPLMSNVNRMVAGQIRDSDLFNGEDVITPARPYRFSQVVHVLSDREDFHQGLVERYNKFSRLYPLFIKGSIILGFGIPILLVLVFALTPTEKVVLLTICLLWLVALFVFLVIVESMRYSLERQLHIDNMSNERLLDFYSAREKIVPANIKVTASNLSISEILKRSKRSRFLNRQSETEDALDTSSCRDSNGADNNHVDDAAASSAVDSADDSPVVEEVQDETVTADAADEPVEATEGEETSADAGEGTDA